MLSEHQRATRLLTVLILLMLTAPMVLAQVKLDPDLPDSLFLGTTGAQFQERDTYPNIRLTNDPATSRDPRAVVDANYVYVVWDDSRDGNREIYWQKFDRNDGTPATSPVRVTNTGGNSVEPAIGIDASGNSYIVWEEKGGNLYGTIYAARLLQDGSISVPPTPVSSNLSIHSDITVEASGTNWITYHRMAPSDQDVYLRKSNSTFGATCSTHWNKGTIPGMAKEPCVAIAGTYVIVAWRDLTSGWQDGIFCRIFNMSCGAIGEVYAYGAYTKPSIDGHGNYFFVSFELSGNIYNLLGNNSVCRINDITGSATNATVATDGQLGWFAWQDSRDGNAEIYSTYAFGCQLYDDIRFTENSAASATPDIATFVPDPGYYWIVWQDNRDGNTEIYLTGSNMVPPQAMIDVQPTSLAFEASQYGDPPPNQTLTISNVGAGILEWEATINPEAQDWLSITPMNGSGDLSEITVSINSTEPVTGTYNGDITISSYDAGNSPVMIPVTYIVNPPAPASFIIYDGANPPQLIRNTNCTVYRVTGAGTEIPIVEGPTDNNGVLAIDPSLFEFNDRVKISVLANSENTYRPMHDVVDNIIHKIYVDNMLFDSEGNPKYDDFAAVEGQEIVLKHTTVKFSLTVSIEWDADQAYIDNLKDGLRKVANYLYDVSNGQCTLEKVFIYDCGYEEFDPISGYWGTADIRVHATNWSGGEGMPAALRDIYSNYYIPNTLAEIYHRHAWVPRVIYWDGPNENADLCQLIYPYDWTRESVNAGARPYPGIRGITHELGHYLLSLLDEYIYKCNGGNPHYDFGLMDGILDIAGPMGSEMSSALDYINAANQVTMQWCWNENRSCWDYFEDRYEGIGEIFQKDGIFRNIERPDEREPFDQIFEGPNNNLGSPSYDVGSQVIFGGDNRDRLGQTVGKTFRSLGIYPEQYIKVELLKIVDQAEYPMSQGITNSDGQIRILGANCGDELIAMRGGILGPIEQTIDEICPDRNDDSVITLSTITDYIPTILNSQYEMDGTIHLNLYGDRVQPVAPVANIISGLGPSYSHDLTINGLNCWTDISESLGLRGSIITFCSTASQSEYFVYSSFVRAPIVFGQNSIYEISSADGSCLLTVDSVAAGILDILVINTDFPVATSGADTTYIQVSPQYSVSVASELIRGGVNGTIYINFIRDVLYGESPSTLIVKKWNPDLHLWSSLITGWDGENSFVYAEFSDQGTYALFMPKPLTGGRVEVEPDPMYAFYGFSVSPILGEAYIGELGGRDVQEIVTSSLLINDSITVDSTQIVSGYGDFENDVLVAYFSATRFVDDYGVIWDTALVQYKVTGHLNDGTLMTLNGGVKIIGHLSGDVNGDGEVNIMDITYLINCLYKNGPPPVVAGSGDVNSSGNINILDVTYLINYLYKGGPEPSCPLHP